MSQKGRFWSFTLDNYSLMKSKNASFEQDEKLGVAGFNAHSSLQSESVKVRKNSWEMPRLEAAFIAQNFFSCLYTLRVLLLSRCDLQYSWTLYKWK